MRSDTTPSRASWTQRSTWTLGLSLFLGTGAGLVACSGDFHSDRGLEDMVCDSGGCWHCERSGSCEEYRCDATHQCPMQRTCSIDHRCLPDGQTTGRTCTSNSQCEVGEICTLEGACVTSPGGGPGKDVSNDTSDVVDSSSPDVEPSDVAADTSVPDTSVADTAVDTGPDTTLPQHPDEVCHTNADCGRDGTCVNGGCYFACDALGKCPPGQGCESGQCRPLEAPENQCTFNGECGTNHACLDGTCFQRCAETLDCPAHTRCSNQRCVASTLPVIQCSGPGSCDAGKSCVDGKCLSACQNQTCADGFACNLGFCDKVATCFDKADCDGADCVDGACAK